MKRLVLISFLINISLSSFSQRVYFLYIQSEAELPFYLKMNDKIYSSAAKGYLILPRLRDSIYNFSIGFSGNNSIEQKFSVPLNGKDHGYVLKNFNEKGWGLFDLQTLSVKMNLSEFPVAELKKELIKKDESNFTQILAKASDDSTLLEKADVIVKKDIKKDTIAKEVVVQSIEKKEEKKVEIEEVKPIPIEKPELHVKVNEEIKTKIEVESQINSEVFKRSQVILKSESSTTEGFGLIFIDEYSNGSKDTIRILIPPTKEIAISLPPEIQGNKKFLEIPDTIIQVVKEKNQVKESEQLVISQNQAVKKNNCQSIGDETDFFKLRKKMAAEVKDDDMILEAKKIFRTKCFTTSQIKNISTLFLNDNGKYNFFDASYLHVSDLENFNSLISELKDEYFQNRFKAMLR